MQDDQDAVELAAPREGDILIGPGKKFPWANACLNFSFTDYGYREGYRRAGKILTDYVLSNVSDQDTLVYPIVYNYRHHIELTIKHLIDLGSYLADIALSADESRTVVSSHDLDVLWKILRPILLGVFKKVRQKFSVQDIEGVDSYIKQLHQVDRGSFTFRYALDKQGSPSLPAELRHLNLYNFGVCMERISDYLEKVDNIFEYCVDKKKEYAEYDAELGE